MRPFVRNPDLAATQQLDPVRARAVRPAVGLLRSASDQFDEDARQYLRSRLRIVTFILFSGFFGFLLLILASDPRLNAETMGLWPHIAVTLLLGGLGGLFLTRWSPTAHVLRMLEIVVFGVPAAFFFWSKWIEATRMPAPLMVMPDGGVQPVDLGFLPSTAIPWILLTQMYGVFIPNTWKRATAMVSLFSAAPLVIAVVVATRREDIAFLLEKGGLVALMLWMAISAVIAIYGSHRFGRLRREAFDARHLGAYTLRQPLGAGGMGEVYLADHRLLKRKAAIKLIRPEKAGDLQAMARFEGEVQATAALTHPNTVEIYDYGHTDDGMFYYVMEFLPGLNLQELVDRHGPLPPARTLHLILQTCSALREAHAAGLIHRDIKPGNIFACERGGLHDVAKLLDFGLVKSMTADREAQLTLDGAMVGSPHFAAPESLTNEAVDQRSDIYSVGATLYFLLTGRTLFTGNNPIRLLLSHQNEPVKPPTQWNPRIPSDLEAVVLKCLAKSPDDRYPDVAALERALASCRDANRWSQTEAIEWWSRCGAALPSLDDTATNFAQPTDQVTRILDPRVKAAR